jgi:hypothetical protein
MEDIMSGIIKIAGSYVDVGAGFGYYWGNYISLLKSSKSRKQQSIYNMYKEWLTCKRDDLKDSQEAVKERFPDVWQEICGMLEGVNNSNVGFKVTLGGLFSCCVAESDEEYSDYAACSTVILGEDNGYVMIHSDEYDAAYPLLASNITIASEEGDKEFFSISHPFQLAGSAAGFNKFFAFQGTRSVVTRPLLIAARKESRRPSSAGFFSKKIVRKPWRSCIEARHAACLTIISSLAGTARILLKSDQEWRIRQTMYL